VAVQKTVKQIVAKTEHIGSAFNISKTNSVVLNSNRYFLSLFVPGEWFKKSVRLRRWVSLAIVCMEPGSIQGTGGMLKEYEKVSH
jgi:hypothetical protein